MSPSSSSKDYWIRGVNLGGWLLLERFIVPLQFALTHCHLSGNFCWYPGQLSAPLVSNHTPSLPYCDYTVCKPYLLENAFGDLDFPMDEYNIGLAFAQFAESNNQYKNYGADWLDYHFNNFVQYEHLVTLKKAGVTHIRVPLPHWLFMTNSNDDDDNVITTLPDFYPYILGRRWSYFKRLVEWCREIGGLQVWPDIHTAPGSQNGFDNSGRQYSMPTCRGWQNPNTNNVQVSLDAVYNITRAIMKEDMRDVVTGFGILNEPFKDCDRDLYRDFVKKGVKIVQENMGADTSIYISDLFTAYQFNDVDYWWKDIITTTQDDSSSKHSDNDDDKAKDDDDKYNSDARLFIDSHYYHVFAGEPRHLSPRQHIAYACQSEYKASYELSGTASCCYSNYKDYDGDIDVYATTTNVSSVDIINNNLQPLPIVKRLIGEWSAAVDVLPVAMLSKIMQRLVEDNGAGYMYMYNRTLSSERRKFLKQFVLAQLLSYEAFDTAKLNKNNSSSSSSSKNSISQSGVSQGWFFWTLRMEGGAFAEWDFLRGLSEGWIPNPLPDPQTSTAEAYYISHCNNLIFETNDDRSVLEEYPEYVPDPDNWQGVQMTDDVVLSHGESLLQDDSKGDANASISPPFRRNSNKFIPSRLLKTIFFIIILLAMGSMVHKYILPNEQRAQYEMINHEVDHRLSR